MNQHFQMRLCVSCKKGFVCDPLLVPAITVRTEREPICQKCLTKINEVRLQKGIKPIVPKPGTYLISEENI